MKPFHIGFTVAGLIGGLGSATSLVLANQGVLSMSPTGAKLVAAATAASVILAAFGHSVVTQDKT